MAKYTVVHLEEVPNVLGNYPGEMRFMKNMLETEQVAITYRRMPAKTGSKGSYGHKHHKIEEITFIISGHLQVKLDDEIIELAAHDAIRIPADVVRGFWNEGPDEVELIIVSTRADDSGVKVEDFWN